MKVRSNMTRDVISISPSDTLKDAYDLMKENEFRHLPVVDEEHLVGVLSERDILLQSEMADGTIWVPETAVEHAMATDVITCRPGTNIAEAAELMIEKKISCLPVIAGDGLLVGMITTTDLLELLAAKDPVAPTYEIPFTYQVRHYRNAASI